MSLVVTLDGVVFSWGPSGKFGQLGHGDTDRQLSPKPVAGLQDHVIVSAHHTAPLMWNHTAGRCKWPPARVQCTAWRSPTKAR